MERDRAIEVLKACARWRKKHIEHTRDDEWEAPFTVEIDLALATLEESPKRPPEAPEFLYAAYWEDGRRKGFSTEPTHSKSVVVNLLRVGEQMVRYKFDGLVPPPSGQEAKG